MPGWHRQWLRTRLFLPAMRRSQMSFRLLESALGLGADALAMPGDVVGDLAQSAVRGGQRLPQRMIAPFNARLPSATAPTPARTKEQQNHHDNDHDDDTDRDPQPVPL